MLGKTYCNAPSLYFTYLTWLNRVDRSRPTERRGFNKAIELLIDPTSMRERENMTCFFWLVHDRVKGDRRLRIWRDKDRNIVSYLLLTHYHCLLYLYFELTKGRYSSFYVIRLGNKLLYSISGDKRPIMITLHCH